jgi:hypothetical protein
VDAFISEHEQRFPVDSAILDEEDGVRVSCEVSESSVSGTGDGIVDNTPRKRLVARVDGIITAARREVTVLEVVRSGKPVRDEYLVVSSVVRVGEGDIAIVKHGVGVEVLVLDLGVGDRID